jgi:excisionase family DNA binding protein
LPNQAIGRKELKMLEKYKELLSVAEMKEALGIGRNAAYQLINENKIKHILVGSKIYIPKWCLLEFLRSADD